MVVVDSPEPEKVPEPEPAAVIPRQPNPIETAVNQRVAASPAAIAKIRAAALAAKPDATDEEIAAAVEFTPAPSGGVKHPNYYIRTVPEVLTSAAFQLQILRKEPQREESDFEAGVRRSIERSMRRDGKPW